MAVKHGLGRGLDALIKDGSEKPPVPEQKGASTIPLHKIKKSSLQPRKSFDEIALAELTLSVKERGVLQPVIVRTSGSMFELIAGERRFRAASAAGLKEIPAVVMEAPDNEALELALVENLQRENLNPLDEAEGYQLLSDKFSMTQDQISERVGKARATVTNAMRLLTLPQEIRTMLSTGQISVGHAKAILSVELDELKILLAKRTVAEGLSVRGLEKIAQKTKAPRKPRSFRTDLPREHLSAILNALHQRFATSVRVSPSRTFANGKKGKGVIEIDFFSNEDLDRLLSVLGITLD